MKRKTLSFLSVLTAFVLIFVWTVSAFAIDERVEKAVELAVEIAEDDTHGYGDTNRMGDPDYDCSSFVCSVFAEAGFDVYPWNNVGSMVDDFTKEGFLYITDIDFTNYEELMRGDILLKDGHTELYIGDRTMVGAHMNYDGKPGDSQGNEVNVRSYYIRGYDGSIWTGVLRFPDNAVAMGDVDLDGEINAYDARFTLRAAVGLENLDEGSLRFVAADTDKNGKIEGSDARMILRAVVGLEMLGAVI